MNTELTTGDLAMAGATPEFRDGRTPPTAEQTDKQQTLAAQVNAKYAKWRRDRQPLEAQWAMNAAVIRGISNMQWNPVKNQLVASRQEPAHRSKDNINRVQTKVKARLSKFLKTRPVPIVTAASTDHEDILNANATKKVLEYQWKRLHLEDLYEETLLWSMQTGKAFWWFFWDANARAKVRTPEDFLTGKQSTLEAALGEPGVDFGSAFETLVADPGISRIQKQPEIMRVRAMDTAEVEARFSLPKDSLKSEFRESEVFQYQRQISALGSRGVLGASSARDINSEDKEPFTHIVLKELFTKPSARFPKGRYVVVAADRVLKESEELPYGFDETADPYPVVEFSDRLAAGQFWPDTLVEQLIPVQTQYNRVRNQIDEGIKLSTHYKVFIPKAAQMPTNAWNAEAGEKIAINWQPGMPPPAQWIVNFPSVNGDAWRMIENLKGEFDEVSNLPASAMGLSGATSGFDTNLLQEAADSVHAPDIARNERALTVAAYKIRRLCKLGYDIPRLITITGRDHTPEAFEFSAEQIDELAEISIEAGSALPQLKHQRIEAILKLDERGLFGPAGDPQRNRRVLKMLELGSQEQATSLLQRDEDHARLENLSFSRGEQVEDPMPWEDHTVEYEFHTDLLKSPEIKTWSPEQRAALVRHTILHVKFQNPQSALQLAGMFGLQDVVAELQQTMLLQQHTAPAAPTGAPEAAPPASAPAQPGAEAPVPQAA